MNRKFLGLLFAVLLAGVISCGDGGGTSSNNGDRANTLPTASAGIDQNVTTGTSVTLDGSGSSDTDGDLLTYSWVFTTVPSGSIAPLSDPSIVRPTFVPDIDGSYVLSLVVNDGTEDSSVDTVTITASTFNSAPVANAGSDQNVSTGTVVTLDGSGSSDADSDALTYSWSIASVPGGSGATLSNTTVVDPTFTADVDGVYVMSLTVNDGTVDSVADTASITAATANSAPVSDAGTDQSVSTGSTVTLDGSGSSDADSDMLTYSWTITSIRSGSNATLSDATLVSPTFTPNLGGSYVFSLTVNDGTVDSTVDTVAITAKGNIPDTGQTKCYDNSSEIICPAEGEAFHGQDAQYSTNLMSYTDNGDDTVTDNVTGLMWQQDDNNITYNWYVASGTYDATNNSATTDVCGDLTLGGYTDWRLPTEDELMSIVNYGTYSPAIDVTYFPNTNSSFYWSNTTYADATDYAWDVNLGYGYVKIYTKTSGRYVRCVR